jgi:hypothetical protein
MVSKRVSFLFLSPRTKQSGATVRNSPRYQQRLPQLVSTLRPPQTADLSLTLVLRNWISITKTYKFTVDYAVTNASGRNLQDAAKSVTMFQPHSSSTRTTNQRHTNHKTAAHQPQNSGSTTTKQWLNNHTNQRLTNYKQSHANHKSAAHQPQVAHNHTSAAHQPQTVARQPQTVAH